MRGEAQAHGNRGACGEDSEHFDEYNELIFIFFERATRNNMVSLTLFQRGVGPPNLTNKGLQLQRAIWCVGKAKEVHLVGSIPLMMRPLCTYPFFLSFHRHRNQCAYCEAN